MLWTALLLVALLVIPGTAVGVAAGIRTGWALAAGPAMTFGIAGLAGWAYGAFGIRFGVVSAAAAWLLCIVIALIWRRFVPALREHQLTEIADDSEDAENVAARTKALRRKEALNRVLVALPALIGVVLSATVLAWTALDRLMEVPHGLQSISQSWDVHWHASVIRSILNDGMASSTRMGDVQNVETHSAAYYPAAWHAVAALYAAISKMTVPAAVNLMGIVPAALLTPLGAAAFAWRMVDRPSMKSSIAAGLAAVLTTPLPVLMPIGFAVGAWPYQLAIALVGVTFALLTSVPNQPRRVLPAMLVLVGIGTLHPSAVPTTVLLGVLWWLFYRVWRPVRPELGAWKSRLRDVGIILGAAIPAAVLLVPQWAVGGEQGGDIRATTAEVKGLDRAGSIYRAFMLLSRHAEELGPIWLVLIIGFVGVALMTFTKRDNRRLWVIVAWLLSVLFTIHGMNHFGTVLGKIVGVYTELHYSTPHRLVQTTAYLLCAAGGVALAAVFLWIGNFIGRIFSGTASDPSARRKANRISVALALCFATVFSAFTVPYGINLMKPIAKLAYIDTRNGRLVSETDLKAFDWLAAQPEVRGHRVLTNPSEGSGWMYARNNIDTIFRHYDWPNADKYSETSMLYWHVDYIGNGEPWDVNAPNDVDRAADALNVSFVYISPPNFWDYQKPLWRLLYGMWWAPGVAPVYKDKEVTIYAVRSKVSDEAINRMRAESPEEIPRTNTMEYSPGRVG